MKPIQGGVDKVTHPNRPTREKWSSKISSTPKSTAGGASLKDGFENLGTNMGGNNGMCGHASQSRNK